MIVVDCQQGSPEWFAARCGKATASRMGDLMAKTRSGWGASRANYASELVIERLTGKPVEKYSNAAMAWGVEQEPLARALYEFLHDTDVRQVGLVSHPTIADALASPDGLVAHDGLIEIKCPQPQAHIGTLKGEPIDLRYRLQMAWQLACTGRQWVDFCSYNPTFPGEMQIHIQRVHRDNDLIAELEREVAIFLVEVDDCVAKLRARYQPLVEAA